MICRRGSSKPVHAVCDSFKGRVARSKPCDGRPSQPECLSLLARHEAPLVLRQVCQPSSRARSSHTS